MVANYFISVPGRDFVEVLQSLKQHIFIMQVQLAEVICVAFLIKIIVHAGHRHAATNCGKGNTCTSHELKSDLCWLL